MTSSLDGPSRREHESYSRIDPEFDVILRKYGQPKIPLPGRHNIGLFRQGIKASTQRTLKSPFMQKHLAKARAQTQWTETDTQIPVADGVSIRTRIYRPTTSHDDAELPVMMLAHSGGLCMGDLDTEAFLCRVLCAQLKVVVIDIDYRLCPEVTFTEAVYDVLNSIKWIASNVSILRVNLSSGFVILGVSAGGFLITPALYLIGQDTSSPPISGFVLLCTGVPHEATTGNPPKKLSLFPPSQCPSWSECKNAPLMTRSTAQAFLDLTGVDPTDPIFTPFLQPDHTSLPGRLYYQVAGLDPWRSSAFLFADLLERESKSSEPEGASNGKSQGTEVRMDVYPGLPHCWWTVYPQLSITEKWLADLVKGVEWCFRRDNGGSGRSDDQDVRSSRL